MNTDTPFDRLFQERQATVFERAGLCRCRRIPPDRRHAGEVKQTAFRLEGALQPETGRDDLPLVLVESQFSPKPHSCARELAAGNDRPRRLALEPPHLARRRGP